MDWIKYIAASLLLILFQACGMNTVHAQGADLGVSAFSWLTLLVDLAKSSAEIAAQSGVVVVVVTGIFNIFGKYIPWLTPFRGLLVTWVTKQLESFAQARALRAVVAAEQIYKTEIKHGEGYRNTDNCKMDRYENALLEIQKSGVAKNLADSRSLLEYAVAKMKAGDHGRA